MPLPKAQLKLTQLIKDVRSKEYKYTPKEENPIDWSSYDEAQLNEMNDYLILVREIIDEIQNEIGDIDQGNVGKPPKSCFGKAKAIMVQQYFECSNRIAAGLVKLFKEKLNIREDLNYKSIETAYDDACVVLVLKLLFEKTNEPVEALETQFSGDGAGLTTSIKQNYASDRNDDKVQLYDKMIGIVGMKFKLLSAVEITEGTANETPFIVPLLEETSKMHKIDLFSYDAAGYSYDVINFVSLGAVPRIFPDKDAVLKAYGCMAKKRMLLDFINYAKWLEEYHTRSISETRNSADKRVFTRPLLKRLDCRRHVEGYARACRYNVRQLVYVHYLHKIPVRWIKNRAM